MFNKVFDKAYSEGQKRLADSYEATASLHRATLKLPGLTPRTVDWLRGQAAYCSQVATCARERAVQGHP